MSSRLTYSSALWQSSDRPSLSGLDKIEALQTNTNEEVYQKAYDLIDTYFGTDDDDDEGVTPPDLDVTGGEYRMAPAASDQPIQF